MAKKPKNEPKSQQFPEKSSQSQAPFQQKQL
jgi:hypothetical protein